MNNLKKCLEKLVEGGRGKARKLVCESFELTIKI